MPLPTERTVTGKYVNPVTGEPYDGTNGQNYVIFEPVPDRWTDQTGNQILLGGGRVNLDASGSFAEDVVCTDADGVLPEGGRLWRLRQYIGGTWDVQYLVVPMGAGAIDITDAGSVDLCGVEYVPVPGPPGEPTEVLGTPPMKVTSPAPGSVTVSLTPGEDGQVLTTANGETVWANPSDGGGGNAVWGSISGTLDDQADLKGALDGKVAASLRGVANGVATLDVAGTVPIAQLPPLPASQISSGVLDPARIPDFSSVYLAANRLGVADGVASLDSGSKVPTGQIPTLPASQIGSGTFATARIPDLSGVYLAVTQKAAASGVASLDASSKIPTVQIPNLPASQINSGTFDSARLPDLSGTYVVTGRIGAASGVASLDTSVKVPAAQIPDLASSYLTTAQKGAANGVASLDSTTKVPLAQVPSLPASQINSGTLAAARIPDLSAAYLAVAQRAAASGVASLGADAKIPVAQIPDLGSSYASLATYGNVYTPSDHGLIAWTMDPAVTSANGTLLSSGFIYMLQVVLRQSATINKINVMLGAAGSGLTANQCLAGLYDTSGNRLAITGDQSTNWSTAGSKAMNLLSSYTAAAGKYYVALLYAGTSSPTFACGSILGSTFTPGNSNLASGGYRFCRSASGQTTLPASVVLTGYTPDANNIYAAIG